MRSFGHAVCSGSEASYADTRGACSMGPGAGGQMAVGPIKISDSMTGAHRPKSDTHRYRTRIDVECRAQIAENICTGNGPLLGNRQALD